MASVSLTKPAIAGIAWLTLSGCAQFKFVGYEPIPGTARQVGPAIERVESYGPLDVVVIPSPSSPALQVRLQKFVTRNIQRDTKLQAVYQRPRRNYVGVAVIGGLFLWAAGADSTDSDLGGLALGALLSWGLWQVDYGTEVRRDALPGRSRWPALDEEATDLRPAAGEILVLPSGHTVRTDAQGVADLDGIPIARYDVGVRVRHMRTGNEYVVRRMQKKRQVTAEWVAAVLGVSTAATATSIAVRINRVRRAARMGTLATGPETVVLGIAVDLLTDRVLSQVIQRFGTSTEQYYDWVVVRTK